MHDIYSQEDMCIIGKERRKKEKKTNICANFFQNSSTRYINGQFSVQQRAEGHNMSEIQM